MNTRKCENVSSYRAERFNNRVSGAVDGICGVLVIGAIIYVFLKLAEIFG